MKTKIEIGNLSDVGKVRSVNEDYFGSYSGKYGNLVIVCDGMGGHSGGAIASRLAVETIKEHFEKLPEKYNEKEQLKLAINKADKALREKSKNDPELNEMGSTAVLMLLKNDQVICAHIGDSRIYMIRNNSIHQLTKDHSLVQQMIDANIISAEAAKDHPKKNVITRSLGTNGNSEPDIAEPLSVFKKDKFILCSDGLTGYVNDNEILQIVSNNSLQAASHKLIDLANERGGKDNITVQIVSIKEGKRLPVKRFSDKGKIIIGTGVVLLLLVVYLGITTFLPMLKGTNEEILPDNKGQNSEQVKDKEVNEPQNIQDSVGSVIEANKTEEKNELTNEGSEKIVKDTTVNKKKGKTK